MKNKIKYYLILFFIIFLKKIIKWQIISKNKKIAALLIYLVCLLLFIGFLIKL